jgi:predicted  nucleic acid-binding Zn-ribbon protein
MAIMAVLGSAAFTAAQDTIKQEPPAKSRVKPSVKPAADPLDKADVKTSQPSESDQAMQRAITSLSTQIGLLNDEVRKLRRETERNSAMMELLLNEDRLAKLEDKIQEAADRKAQLDAREQELVRRSRNIQGELVLRGGLRRDEAEAAIRSDIQRALDDVHSQQAAYQQRAAELVEQSTRVRARVETLRKKFELSEEKNPQEKD